MRKNISRFSFLLPPALTSLLLITAFPDFGVSVLAWFAPSLMIYASLGSGVFRSALQGFAAGFIFYLGSMYWTAGVMAGYGGINLALSWLFSFMLYAYLAIYFSAFSMAVSWFRQHLSETRALTAAPFIWVTLEYIRTYALTGLPWNLLANSQYRHPVFLQICSVTGIYGLSFMMVALSSILVYMCIPVSGKSKLTAGVIFTACFTAILIWSFFRLENPPFEEKGKIRTGVIQGNVPQGLKMSGMNERDILEDHLALSLEAAAKDAELIVWSESTVPMYFEKDNIFRSSVTRFCSENRVHMVLGSVSSDGDYLKNSAFTVDSCGMFQQRYDKRHLVPFGEYVPLYRAIPFIRPLVNEVGTFNPGGKAVINSIRGIKFGVPVCYEIIFPGNIRDFAGKGAEFIVNITNDGWYGKTSACAQHFSHLPFRAVENFRSIARSANTGISGFIGPTGIIVSETELETRVSIVSDVPAFSGKTFYSLEGDVFILACIMFLVGLTVTALLAKKRKYPRP